MGCGQSKPTYPRAKDSAAVALCRHRSALLAEAISHRYALADAHRAYAASLQATGATLHDFLRTILKDTAPPPSEPSVDLILPQPLNGECPEPLPVEHDAERVHDGDDGDGHRQFPSNEETQPPLPQPEHPLPKPEHLLPQPEHPQPHEHPLPQLEHRLPQPEHPLPQPEHRLHQPEHPPQPEHPLPQPEPLKPAAPATPQPLQMAAPYGCAPPYSSCAGGPSSAYGGGYGAEMGTYSSGDPSSAYGRGNGAETGTYSSDDPSSAYGGGYGAETGTYSSGDQSSAYGGGNGAEMGTYSSGDPSSAYGGGYGAETGTYSSGDPSSAYGGSYGAETGTYSPGGPSYPYGGGYDAETITFGPGVQSACGKSYGAETGTYGPGGPSYAHGTEMGSYGHNLVSTVNYALSQPPSPSVAYEHGPQVTNATVHDYQDDDASRPQPQLPSSYYCGYPYHQHPQGGSFSPVAPSSRQPAAPLPPSRVSTWDSSKPSETSESYNPEQPATMANPTPSWTSSDPPDEDDEDMLELEDEDMPELEDEELGEVVGEAYGGVDCTIVNAELAKEEERRSSATEELHQKTMLSDGGSSTLGVEESKSLDAGNGTRSSTVHVVEEQQVENSAVDGLLAAETEKMVQEIKTQFDLASKSAGEVCKALEVGKMPYTENNLGFKVSSIMICGFPSKGKKFLLFEEEKAMECGNISSTLLKLYMWEKKLLEEVKTEEKLRVLYDQKYEELKFLYNRGAEAHKLEAVQICIRKLSTKISVAIQSINSISNKINKLRDEELWPQIHELIQGFMQMWHTTSECYQIQCHAMSQAKDIDSTIAAATFSEAYIDLLKQLELQLLDMSANFAAWFSAQKSYVSTLNEWLKKGIEYVPEVTDDGVPPFSPGRLGAPPVFTICNNWATSMERISEMEVLYTMHAFASNVLGLWERQRSEWRQGMLAEKDMGRRLRLMTRDEMSMRKALEAQKMKLVLVSSQGSGLSSSAQMLPSEAGLQSCMHKSFEAMESFAAACTNALKDLHVRSQEERARLAQEKGTAS